MRWMKWTLAAAALATAANVGFACDEHANSADAKDVKAAVQKDGKGCDMPCCAHAKDAADVKTVADAKAAAAAPAPAAAAAETPCAAHNGKGCPKKAAAAATVAKSEPEKESPKAESQASSGSQR